MVQKKEKKGSDEKRSQTELEKILIQNFVALQSSFSKMAVKMDGLTTNISRLLELFEKSAREFVGNQGMITKEEKEFIEKLDKLIDQNKIIAKGLTLMEERIREKVGENKKEVLVKEEKIIKKPEDILGDRPKPKLLPSI